MTNEDPVMSGKELGTKRKKDLYSSVGKCITKNVPFYHLVILDDYSLTLSSSAFISSTTSIL